MRYRESLTIPIALDRDAISPMHQQIAGQVTAAVDSRALLHGTRMPSTRTLADLLGVSRGVAVAAYAELFARGYLEGQPGSGTYVVDPRPSRSGTRAPVSHVDGPPVDLTPGQPSGEAFPLASWRAAWREASFRPPAPSLPPPFGLGALRQAVGEHLVRTRGISLQGREVIVTSGAGHGLRLVLDALGLCGSAVAVEEPVAPAVLAAGGDDPVPLPVDREGARIDGVPPSCRALVLGPDAQMPTGAVLSARRREAAAAWARHNDGWLVELACDAVFRPGAAGLPRLLGPAAGGTATLVGGFCDVLTPALKLGYAVVPAGLARQIARRLAERAEQPPHVTQLAVAALLRDGTVLRRMYRLGRLYAGKRRLVESALAALSPHARLDRFDGVGTVLLHLPPGVDATVVSEALRAVGIRVPSLAEYHFSGRPAANAIVVGYGHLPDAALHTALADLADALHTELGFTRSGAERPNRFGRPDLVPAA